MSEGEENKTSSKRTLIDHVISVAAFAVTIASTTAFFINEYFIDEKI